MRCSTTVPQRRVAEEHRQCRRGHADEPKSAHPARPLYERALATFQARLGKDHPYTATSLSNLANVLADQGDLDAARTLYEQAPSHP